MKRYSISFKIFISSIFFLIVLFVLCACAPGLLQEGKTKQVRDATGIVRTIVEKPKRIVAMDISNSEMVLLLASSERILAVSRYLDDPGVSNLTTLAENIPYRTENSAEQVVGLKPDLVVIATPGKDDLVGQLEQLKQPVFLIKQAATMKEIEENIQVLAKALGEEKRGQQLVKAMEQDLHSLQRRTKEWEGISPKCVVRISNTGAMGGTETFFNDVAHVAGCINAAEVVGLAQGVMSKEQLLKANPDILVFPIWDHNSGKSASTLQGEYENDPALVTLKAIREKNFAYIPDWFMICRSPYAVYAASTLAEVAYGVKMESNLEKILPENTVRRKDPFHPQFVMSPLEKKPMP